MAAVKKKLKRYGFELPLKVSSEKLMVFEQEHLKSVYDGFSEDVPLLNKYFQKADLPFIKFKSVSYIKGSGITFTFEVETEEELKNFYKASKAKVLSKVLTEYAMTSGIGIKASLKVDDNLQLFLELGKIDYHRHMTVLCEDDARDSSKNISVIPLPATEFWPEKHEKHISKTPDITTCSCDFYIFLTKRAHMDSIFLASECKELDQLKLKAVPACDGMWEGHVEVPADKMKCISYQFVANKEEGIYFKTVKVYTSEHKFMHNNVRRHEFVPKDMSLQNSSTKEGYIMHCLHILNISNRSDVFQCIRQIEGLYSSYSYGFSFEDAVEIMTKLQSVISYSNAKGLILLCVILMINVKNIWKFFDKNHISKDMVKAILESFRSADFDNFSEYCKRFLPDLLQKLCMFHSGSDYNLLHFIYWTYPFLDESFFIQEIVHHASKQKHLSLADGASFEILQEVIFVISSRVEMDVPAVGLLERLFRHLPFSLSFRSYKYLCTCLSAGNQIHNAVKDKLNLTLSTSFVANISINVSQGRMTELFNLWEIVQDDEDVAIKIRDKLQQNLVSFVEKRTDKMLPDELQSLVKMICHAKLFVDENTHEHLLRVLGQSKIKNLHELFITVLWDQKFCNCLLRYPCLLLEWLETAVKCHVKDDVYPRGEDEICGCYAYLHDALAVPVLPQDGQLQRKLEDYVFKWLSKLDIKQVLRKLDDMEKLNEKKSMVLDLYQKHVLQLLQDQCESSRPEDILLSVCGTMGELRVNSRSINNVRKLFVF